VLENDQDQGLLTHNPIREWGPATIFNNESSKIGPKFSVCVPIILGPVGVTS